jgi:uncharacterized protein involved in exopolysaccharide biosynthesis
MTREPRTPGARARLRTFVAAIFRRRETLILSFLGLASLATLAASLQPVHYWARARLLVTRDRIDAMATPVQDGTVPRQAEVTPQELQSEAEILASRDLLRGVVTACGVAERSTWLHRALQRLAGTSPPASSEAQLDRLVMELNQRLDVEVIEKSNLIQIAYPGATPTEAHCVLDTLTRDYAAKHLALQRPAGTLRFFQEAAAGYRQALAEAESRLREFGQNLGTGAVDLQTDVKVRNLGEAEALLQETNAGISELTERNAALRAQLAGAPERRTTQRRTADNGQLMERLKSTLLDLELKHTAMASRYARGYLPLQDLERQIEQTRAAIASAAAAPLVDQTTDSDPTYDWLRSELTRTEAELAALKARAAAAARVVTAARAEIRALSDRAIEHQDLERQVRAQEENYLLYLRKQEEARIAQALDSQGITNVVVAEAPNVPDIPSSLRLVVWLAGMICATLGALLLALLVDSGDPSFRTVEDVQQVLALPVLASFPRGTVGGTPFTKSS